MGLGIHDFALFVAAGLLLNVTPGPDMLYIMGRSAAQGRAAGAAAALGIGAGCLVHVAAAAIGLSALVAASATAFTIVKLLGAAYLVYVGASMMLAPAPRVAPAPPPPAAPRAIFVQGFFTNVLNPKVALFFLAFVPQFVAADAEHHALGFLVLGLVFDVNGTLWNLAVAAVTAAGSRRFRSGRAVAAFQRGVGAIFVALGVKLAFAERP